ncbi:MAG: LytTR family DNA-binding domain-containing protein [Chitinophagales bacterium]|nr:LytTR family DNA-binding domain-containing protein [Chitinophagales bacterium]
MSDTKIKCVVVEDEQHTARLIENYISQIKQLEWLGSFVTPVELLNFARIDEVQIIYLDIQMPGMTGVDFLKLKPVNAEIIFTTAYSKYALEGYELDVTDYLLKPVELPRFIKATQKAIDRIHLKSSQSNTNEKRSEYILLKVDKKLIRIAVNEIIYVQSDWNYVHVHTPQKKYMVLSTMKGMENELASYDFARIHKSFLINLHHFESIEGNLVQLKSGTRLQVSRNYKQGLMERLA